MTEVMSGKNIVLYADDDIDDLQLVEEAFSQYSQNVELITVKDGIEALSYLVHLLESGVTPCLIILDINMPRMDGKETLIAVRKMKGLEKTPAILFTTSSQTIDKEFARKYNAGFLTKPIDCTHMEIIAERFINHCSDEIKKNIAKNSL
ncbi:MAG: response regulator [Segetibacter sp.]|jgi:CheY-like chemotaxis protein|nr:response regulator [Segetibacter sp.]